LRGRKILWLLYQYYPPYWNFFWVKNQL